MNLCRREARLPTKSALKAEFDELYAVVSRVRSPVVFAHNDLLLGNILYDSCSVQPVIFIDYEYADYNLQAYEIGNHFAEFAGECFTFCNDKSTDTSGNNENFLID